MSEIADAMDAMNERKRAVTGDASATPAGKIVEVDGIRLLVVGLGLDAEDLLEQATAVAAQSIESVGLQGPASVPHVFAGTWVDGLLTGLTLAERREKPPAPDGEDENGVCPNCHSTEVETETGNVFVGLLRCTECAATWRGRREVIE